MAREGSGQRDVLVRAMAWEAQDVLSLTLASPEGAALPRWDAGAHVDLVAPGGKVAQYSLCGPLDAPTWRIAVLLQRQGQGVSRHVHEQLRPGQLVRSSDPRNHFRLAPGSRYLFIAGGIGITPILPMIQVAARAGSDWELVYGGRSRRSMGFLAELEGHGPRVRLFPEDEAGRPPLADCLDRLAPQTLVYCCGPAPLIAAVESLAAERGLKPPVVERFAAAPAGPAATADGAFLVKLARSGREVTVPADRPVVDVLLEQGIHVPTSCRQGVCGSCETRVLAGRVDHRDAILSDAERQRHDTMMVCVSRALDGELTLDL